MRFCRATPPASGGSGATQITDLAALTLNDPAGLITGRSGMTLNLADVSANTKADVAILDLGALGTGVFVGEIEVETVSLDNLFAAIGVWDTARGVVLASGHGNTNLNGRWQMPTGGTGGSGALAGISKVVMACHVTPGNALGLTHAFYDASGNYLYASQEYRGGPTAGTIHGGIIIARSVTGAGAGTIKIKSAKWRVA